MASIAGGFDIGDTFIKGLGHEGVAEWLHAINDLASLQAQTGEVQCVPAIAPDPSGGLAFMPNEEAYSYYFRTSAADAPTWENRVVAKSLQPYFIYNSIAHAVRERVSVRCQRYTLRTIAVTPIGFRSSS